MNLTSLIFVGALFIALMVDRYCGEPATRWHPVVWMGHYLNCMQRYVLPQRAEASDALDSKAFTLGALAWIAGAALVGLLAVALQWAVLQLPALVSALLLGLALKPMLAWTMLAREVQAVEDALGESLAAGRERLSWLVSRDTTRLSESEVRESAIESLTENLNDSVVAPILWFVVFGLPGAAIYRFANTADAMWGYRGMRNGVCWEWAGKWAARADDVLSWLPARLTALLLAVVAPGVRLASLRQEASKTPSPNSGWPMAAMALALGVCLHKPGVYTLNPSGVAPRPSSTFLALKYALKVVATIVLCACVAIFSIAFYFYD